MLSVKVVIPQLGQSTMMRFNRDCSVMDVCKQVHQKYFGESGGADHGLFRPPALAKTSGEWLKMERTLMHYNIENQDELHYKKKHRPVRISLIGGALRTMLLDDSLVVMELVRTIGEKLNISNFEEYSLMAEGVWLNPILSLSENGVESEQCVVIFKKRWFYSDGEVDMSNQLEVHLLFEECRHNVVHGIHIVSRDDAVALAALDLQVQFGDFNPDLHKPSWVRVGELVPPTWAKQIRDQLILVSYRKLCGMRQQNAKYRYVQLCRASKTFGMALFLVRDNKLTSKKLISRLLGISRDGICLLDPEDHQVLRSWPLTHMKRWASSPKSFTLDFGDYEPDYVTLATTEGEQISQQLAGYIDIILKRSKDRGRVEYEDESIMATEESVAPIRSEAVTTFTSAVTQTSAEQLGAKEFQLTDGQHSAGRTGLPLPYPHLVGRGVQKSASVSTGSVPFYEPTLSLLSQLLSEDQGFASACAKLLPADLTPEDCRAQLRARSEALARSASVYSETLKDGQKGDSAGFVTSGRQVCSDLLQLVAAARRAALVPDSDDAVCLLSSARAVSEAIAAMLKTTPAEPISNPDMVMEVVRSAQSYFEQLAVSAPSAGRLVLDSSSSDAVLASAKVLSEAVRSAVSSSLAPQQQIESLLSAIQSLSSGSLSSPQARQHFLQLVSLLGSQVARLLSAASEDPSARERLTAQCEKIANAIASLRAAVSCVYEELPAARESIRTASESLVRDLSAISQSTSAHQIDTIESAVAQLSSLVRVATDPKSASSQLTQIISEVNLLLSPSAISSSLGRISSDAANLQAAASCSSEDFTAMLRTAKSIATSAYDTVHATDLPSGSRELRLAAAQLALVAAQLGRVTKMYVKGTASSANLLSALSQLRKAQKAVSDVSKPSDSLLGAAVRLRTNAVTVCDSLALLLDASSSYTSSDAQARARLTAATSRALDALSALSSSARGLLPEVQLCDQAIESLTVTVKDVDSALAKSSQPAADSVAYRSHCEALSGTVSRIAEALSSAPSDLGVFAKNIAAAASPLAQHVSLAASTASTSSRSLELLRVAKKLSADLLDTAMCVRSAAASSTSSSSASEIQVASQTASRAVAKLSSMLETDLYDLKELEDEENDDRRAERELQKAVASIDRAAASLAAQREENKKKIAVSSVSASDPVLDTASAVTVSIASLLRAAVAAQRVRVMARGADKTMSALYRNDPMWANGLISAAQTVAATTSHLVHITNAQQADESLLLACVSAVNASTAQLVSASRAKCADPQSETQRSLEQAAKSVSKATAELASAAQRLRKEPEAEPVIAALPLPSASSASALHRQKIEELEYTAKILRMEKELAEARSRFLAMRKDQYAGPSGDVKHTQ